MCTIHANLLLQVRSHDLTWANVSHSSEVDPQHPWHTINEWLPSSELEQILTGELP